MRSADRLTASRQPRRGRPCALPVPMCLRARPRDQPTWGGSRGMSACGRSIFLHTGVPGCPAPARTECPRSVLAFASPGARSRRPGASLRLRGVWCGVWWQPRLSWWWPRAAMSKSSRTRVPAYSRQSCGVPTRRRLVRSARADRSFVVAGGERVRRLRAAAVGRVGVLSRATASPEHPTTTQRCMPIVNELLIQPQRIGLNSNTNTSAGTVYASATKSTKKFKGPFEFS